MIFSCVVRQNQIYSGCDAAALNWRVRLLLDQ